MLWKLFYNGSKFTVTGNVRSHTNRCCWKKKPLLLLLPKLNFYATCTAVFQTERAIHKLIPTALGFWSHRFFLTYENLREQIQFYFEIANKAFYFKWQIDFLHCLTKNQLLLLFLTLLNQKAYKTIVNFLTYLKAKKSFKKWNYLCYVFDLNFFSFLEFKNGKTF